MQPVEVCRIIAAPAATVYAAVADIEHFARAIEGVTAVEFLSDQRAGTGTRYRTTRHLQGKRHVMDFEIREAVPDHRVRIVNETHGTLWDSQFSLRPASGGVALHLRMTASTPRLLPRLVLKLFRRTIRKGVERDLDAVKRYCEGAR